MKHATAFNVFALALALAVSGLLGFHALWVTPAICLAIFVSLVQPVDAEHQTCEEYDIAPR